MADPAKSKPNWSFGATGSTGNTGDTNSLFGQKNLNTSNAPAEQAFSTFLSGSSQPSLFGGQSNTQQGSSLFGGGGSSTTQPSSLFGGGSKENQGTSSFGGGSNAQGSSLFGGGSKENQGASAFGGGSNAQGSSLFGGGSKENQSNSPFGGGSNAQGSSLFGGGSKENQGNSPFGGGSTAQGSSMFGGGAGTGNNPGPGNQPAGFGFGQNTQQPPTSGSNQTSNIFGGVATTGSSTLFGNAGGSTSSAPTSGAQTPTSKPTGGFSFGPSTTPAGPPPANPLNFGIQKPQEQMGGGFLSAQSKSSEQDKASATAPSSNLFSGAKSSSGFLQTSQPSDSNTKTSTSASSPSIFSNRSGGNLFSNRPEAQPTAGLFNNLGKASAPKTPNESAASAPQQSQPEAPKSLFTNIGAESAATSMSGQSSAPSLFSPRPQATDTPKPSLTFGDSKAKLAESSTPTTSAPSLFGGQKSSAATPTARAPASSNSSNTFASLGKAPEQASETKDTMTTATAPSLVSAAPLSSGPLGVKPAAPASTNTAANATSSNAANLGSSTSGPPPTAQSRLKNKSMDEIITRWASDLSKYQKDFQKQAEKIAGWDRMLVENSDKIQKLYGSTLEAQRATSEVERQLTIVENEQEELETYLDYYEKQVEEMIQAHGGQEGSLQGPDKERQETYELAERLTERLDDMGKDLTSMIEEINDTSSSLNKNSKPEDPLSQVVKVLNSHLTQLQLIDQGTAALQAKVEAAQKATPGFGSSTGYKGPTSDAADSFYKSYMGRR